MLVDEAINEDMLVLLFKNSDTNRLIKVTIKENSKGIITNTTFQCNGNCLKRTDRKTHSNNIKALCVLLGCCCFSKIQNYFFLALQIIKLS